MSPAEVKALLAVASAVDGRQVTDLTAQAWLDVPGVAEIALPDARQALAEHRATADVWFEPRHLIAGARRIGQERAEAIERERRAAMLTAGGSVGDCLPGRDHEWADSGWCLYACGWRDDGANTETGRA